MGSQVSTRTKTSEDAAAILDSLRRIVRHLRVSSSEAESKLGMSSAQLFVLSQLKEGSSSSIRELAARTSTDPSSVSVVLDRLEERRFVVRVRDPEDRRRTKLEITPLGARRLAQAPELPQLRFLRALEGVPSARRKILVQSLAELTTLLGADAAKAELFFENGDLLRAHRARLLGARAEVRVAAPVTTDS